MVGLPAALSWMLSSRLFEPALVDPLNVTRRYASSAPSRAEIDAKVFVPKEEGMEPMVSAVVHVEPFVLYSHKCESNPVDVL